MGDYILGLDMGTASIGWVALECDAKRRPTGLIDCGSRIFEEVVNLKTRVPKNRARRAARQARKLLVRRKMRRNNLLRLLESKKMLPEDDSERTELFADNKRFDPYCLRRRALDERLSLFEFGRVIYHLNQRRGFQSNRKAGDKKEEGKVKSAINTLRAEMEEAGSRTLGEFLASQKKKRERYTEREMYKEEFEEIWTSQQKYHKVLRDKAFKVKVHNAIFFQRPLKIQKHLVGKCTFEPRRKRAARALLEYQRFRILQDVNHLAVKDPITRDSRPLSEDERSTLLELLAKQKTLGFDSAKKKLGLHENETFNLEEGKKKKLLGDQTFCTLKNVIGREWKEMTEDERRSLITDMLTIDNEDGFLRRMKEHWKLDDETAEKLAKTELAPGYGRLSLKAIRAILPHLEEGLRYDEACEAAGYSHTGDDDGGDCSELPAPPHIRNPVVQKALHETRKLVNAVMRRHGKPSVIRIEMVRDMKLTKKQKEDLHKRQTAQRKKNDEAREVLQREFNIEHPGHADIQKYNLWEECKHTCPYTGRTISREMLFSPEVEVEHILPWRRSIDDSYMNKTLCMASENKTKHNKTPFEAYSGNQEKYLEILSRVKTMPWPKKRRFEQKKLDTDKCVERQLNDTRYISREVKTYLKNLGVRVGVTRGEATATLRYKWGLNAVLDETGAHKNREDHRHHAIDAIVVALTSKKLFERLSRISAQSGLALSQRGFTPPEPWEGFYDDVKKRIASVVVSHAPSRSISGAFHEETAYGYSDAEGCYVYRKPLGTLTPAQVKKIRDKKIKELVEARLKEYGGDAKKAFGDEDKPLLHVDGKTPIRSVRIKENKTNVLAVERDGKAYKFFDLGNNHHIEIIRNTGTGRIEYRVVSALEAARRARVEKKPIVEKDHGLDRRLVMSLCRNDMIEVVEDGAPRFYRVQMMNARSGNITFRYHSTAATEGNTGVLRKYPKTLLELKPRKVHIDPLGSIRYAND